MSESKKSGSIVIAVVIAAIISFGGGFAVSRYVFPVKSAAQDNFARFANGQGMPNGAGGQLVGRMGDRTGAGGGFISGEILKIDATSISIKQQDGSSKLVLVTSSTKALKTSESDMSGLVVGEQVTAIGTTNSDGSITAQTVQVRPEVPLQQPNNP